MEHDRRQRYEAMYRRHAHEVLAYALRRSSVEAAKDAVAETFVVAWRRFDELPRDPLPWLIQTTRRTLANQRRSSARQTRVAGRLAHELRPHSDVSERVGDLPLQAALDSYAQQLVAGQPTREPEPCVSRAPTASRWSGPSAPADSSSWASRGELVCRGEGDSMDVRVLAAAGRELARTTVGGLRCVTPASRRPGG